MRLVHGHGMGRAQIGEGFLGLEVGPPGGPRLAIVIFPGQPFQGLRLAPQDGQVAPGGVEIVGHEQAVVLALRGGHLQPVAGQFDRRVIAPGGGLGHLDRGLVGQQHLVIGRDRLVGDQGFPG